MDNATGVAEFQAEHDFKGRTGVICLSCEAWAVRQTDGQAMDWADFHARNEHGKSATSVAFQD